VRAENPGLARRCVPARRSVYISVCNTNELQYWNNAHNSGAARDFCTQSKYCIKWQTDFAFFPVIIHENS
jgi:hypothetical protein